MASGDLAPAPPPSIESRRPCRRRRATRRRLGSLSRGRLDRERRAASLTGGRVAAPTRAATKPPSKARARELKEGARATLKRLQRRAKQVIARRDREREARNGPRPSWERAGAALKSTEEELAGLEDEIADNERLLTRLER